MPAFKLPLSGNVTQTFFPITINLGESSAPDIESDALSLASYGKQLGRIEDLLVVLLKRLDANGGLIAKELTGHERNAIRDFKVMVNELANLKERHGARLILRPD